MNSAILMALGRHDGGALIENADEMAAQVARDVIRYGQKGSVTITLTFAPNGEGTAIKLSAAVKSTAPKRPQGEAFYWVTDDGGLTRTPPKDDDLFGQLRPVPSTQTKE